MSIKSQYNVLVVGSWAKEQITIQNLQKNPNLGVYAYMDTVNPGIVKLVKGCKLGLFSDIDGIVKYAGDIEAKLVLPTTAEPLSLGLIDALARKNIKGFGPTQNAARLEADKAFTRNLLARYRVPAIPEFRVFDSPQPAVDYAAQLGWQVAVKPIGLTDGLGVKVFGDQLKDENAVKEYIQTIFFQKIGGDSRVIVEQKLTGVEFTLQCMVDGDCVVPTPAVQDFKKLLPGEEGVNTASMGSYADTGRLLPFLLPQDYAFALRIIRETLKAFHQETGERCRGFLYGQFMYTKDGIKLIEYNFRPGDPEWMNTLYVLEDNILDIILDLEHGIERELTFAEKATVCQYIVPPEYPHKLNETLHVQFDEADIKERDVDLYYSCGITAEKELEVGSERGIALLAKDDTIEGAHRKIEEALKWVKGDYFYRNDIGTDELIQTKVDMVKEMRGHQFDIRQPDEKEFIQVYAFVSHCPPLERYFEHFYKIMLRYFRNTCFMVKYQEQVVGFVLGFISQTQEATYFLWQIGVDPLLQGTGLGKILLQEVEKGIKRQGANRIEVTVDPENAPSRQLFEKMGYANISVKEGDTVEVDGYTAVKDYYRPNRHFMLYEKYI